MAADMSEELSPDARAHETSDIASQAVADLAELVEGTPAGRARAEIKDPTLHVHTAFRALRSATSDNDLYLFALAKLEYDFIAGLGALNSGSQERQLKAALAATRAFALGQDWRA